VSFCRSGREAIQVYQCNLIITYSFKNNNQRAKGVIETQKWANNKKAGGVTVIPCNLLLHVAKEGESFKK